MLKALIIAADSVSPYYIFEKRELFPNLCQMIERGASASYSAYVQKGYEGSYSSEQNWASVYTGLTPQEHGITTHNVRGEKRRPKMQDFNGLGPFWQVLNDGGLSVGLWAAENCASPEEINGYVVSCNYETIEAPIDNREAKREIQFCEKDRHLAIYFNDNPPPRLYPKTISQQGYSFEQLKYMPDLAEEAVRQYHFQDSLPNFEEELEYWFGAIRRVQRDYPVDVLYLYTPTTDLIAHCCMCSDDNPILISAYQTLDRYIGYLTEEFCPEITVFLSDHGQQNFKDLIKCSDPEVQREAFAARDEVIWLKNGYIAFEAYNGALLFTAHSLKGTFIAAGEGIRNTAVDDMRTVDIYTTLMECFCIKIPEGRSGFISDIFNRPLVNSDKLLRPGAVERKSIALLQTLTVNRMDIIINELYIEHRFYDITVVGDPKYEEIFINNPRVAHFIPFEDFDSAKFDEIYSSIFDENTGLLKHIKISGDIK